MWTTYVHARKVFAKILPLSLHTHCVQREIFFIYFNIVAVTPSVTAGKVFQLFYTLTFLLAHHLNLRGKFVKKKYLCFCKDISPSTYITNAFSKSLTYFERFSLKNFLPLYLYKDIKFKIVRVFLSIFAKKV